MIIKGLALYTALYIAGAASSIVAVHQLVPARQAVLPTLSGSAAGFGGFSGQVVNRAGKGDRLPIRHPMSRSNGRNRLEAPARGVPNAKPGVRCAYSPADVTGRCFADASRASHQA
jgi:hypothetical protein